MILGPYEGSRFFLYELIDPRSGACHYVGSSDRGMIRPKYHAYPSARRRDLGPGGNVNKANWIASLPERDGFPFDIRVTQEFVSSNDLWALVPPPVDGLGAGRFDDLDYPEEWLIRLRRKEGAPLTNAAPGGPSPMLGRRHTEASRKKISAAGRNRLLSKESRAKIASTLSGHAVSNETRARISAANKGRAVSDELRIRRGDGVRKSWTPERRAAAAERLKLRHALKRKDRECA